MKRCLVLSSLALLFAITTSFAEGNKKYPIILPKTHKNYTVKLPKSEVSFEMIAIPGGTYLMGSPKGEKNRKADEQQHPVTVGPLWVGKCEVTWDEFDVYWKATKKDKGAAKPKKEDADAITRPTPPYADETFGHGREGHPVLCISHHTAMEYCRWLSKVTGHNYRLPTEAEWKWGCRAGTTTTYSWGDDPKKGDAYAWSEENSEDEITSKVGTKKPNPWGLHDMHGNLAEWCLDHYHDKSYSKFPTDKPTLHPVFLPTKARFSHVARGGSWAHQLKDHRSARRFHSTPSWLQLDPQRPQSIWWLTSAEFVGFRVVRGVKDPKKLQNLRSKVTRASPNYLDEE